MKTTNTTQPQTAEKKPDAEERHAERLKQAARCCKAEFQPAYTRLLENTWQGTLEIMDECDLDAEGKREFGFRLLLLGMLYRHPEIDPDELSSVVRDVLPYMPGLQDFMARLDMLSELRN